MKLKSVYFLLSSLIAFTVYTQNKRPQEPKAPFDYEIEEVVFNNKLDSISLAGTLTYPKKGSNFPAVILISGSGAQDRNSELLDHKSFLVIADYLTNNGFAVLRVDDRGIGESEGVYNEASLHDFVMDTESAFDYLKTHKKIDPKQIGLIGHSLGGVIAPIMASEHKDIPFIVMLAGSGMRGAELVLLQKEKIERRMGMSEEEITKGQNYMQAAYTIILNSDPDELQLQSDLKNHFQEVFGAMLSDEYITAFANKMAYPWFTDFIKFDPHTSLSKTSCPVLALIGSNDLQVPAKENLEAIERILKENGNNAIKAVQLDNLNHLFQESETGLPYEYATIEQTFSPEVLALMTKWIKKQTD